MRHVIFYLHGSVLAGLLTLLTADTSDITLYHNGFTTFGAATGYMSGCVVWNQGDKVLWAGGDTFAAGFAFFFVYNGYTVDDMYGIERTGFGTVAKAKATVAADFGAAIWHISHHGTVFDTGVGVLDFGLFTVTCAVYEGYLTGSLCDFFSHDGGDFGCYRRPTDGTSVCRGFAFGDGCSHTVTAGVATATTVIARKSFTDLYFTGICVYMESFTGDSQQDADYDTCTTDHNGGQKNCCTHLSSTS